jgi:hypothetical protein
MNRLFTVPVLTAAAAFAQVDTGAIGGLVLDEPGVAIVGVEVTIVNAAPNIEQRLATNASRFYASPAVRPGVYSILVRRMALPRRGGKRWNFAFRTAWK